ncbi:MAG: UDP-N-acetylmuramoyl-tripeptide--D-alanyl-D-alanine ligase [Candidatus Promineifilaceae bacterium]|jgi:UDP-N-acetylmuramoyl-tripeptide--D-alanyl-D-alanine ligase
MLNIGHPVAAFGGYTVKGDEPAITSFEIDSREAKPGSVFVAFDGEQVDGHKYVPKAFENGAIVALVERPIDGYPAVTAGETIDTLPSSPFCLVVDSTITGLQQIARFWRNHFNDLKVIGITGSIGKTSTKELAWNVLSNRFSTLKTPKNYNNEIGLPLTLLQLKGHHTHALLEMGMYEKGEIALLCEIARPDIGVMTIIGPVHMSRLGSIEAIVEAKRELPEALPSANVGGIAILNKDDHYVMSMLGHTKAKVFTYGLDSSADLWADTISSMGLEGIAFTMHYQNDSWHVSVPLLGRHSVHTALRATAIGLAVGLSMDEIIVGLKSSKNQVRLVTVRGPKDSLILDDTYNAMPDSVIAALNLLDDLQGRKIAVLGDMLELGSAEEAGHRKVGVRAAQISDILVTVGERGKIIGNEAINAGMPEERVYILENADLATELLQSIIESTDIILIKGSLGARMDRIVANLSRTKGEK